MKQLTKYMCEKCRAEFSTESSAEACEKKHLVPLENQEIKCSYAAQDSEYPDSIIIRFGLSKQEWYYRLESPQVRKMIESDAKEIVKGMIKR